MTTESAAIEAQAWRNDPTAQWTPALRRCVCDVGVDLRRAGWTWTAIARYLPSVMTPRYKRMITWRVDWVREYCETGTMPTGRHVQVHTTPYLVSRNLWRDDGLEPFTRVQYVRLMQAAESILTALEDTP